MVSTSVTSGTFDSSSGSELSRAAAICGSAAFLAPRNLDRAFDTSAATNNQSVHAISLSLAWIAPAKRRRLCGPSRQIGASFYPQTPLTSAVGDLGILASFDLDWICYVTNPAPKAKMSPSRSTPSIADGHAILADRVFDGHCWHAEAAVLVRDGRIVGVGSSGEVPADWPRTQLPAGAFVAPGFIDLQVNGGGGVLLNDQPTAEGMRAIARAHRRYGTTGCLPTLISDTREQMRTAIAAARSVAGRDGVLGLHLEGPFISPRRPGVHRPDRIVEPAAGDLELLCELAGAGRSLVTLAPECVPAGFIRKLAASGVRISIGHSEASAAIVMQAAADGATGVTHLFNAMPPMSARDPGIVGTTLAEDRLVGRPDRRRNSCRPSFSPGRVRREEL